MATSSLGYFCSGDCHVRVNPSRHQQRDVQHMETLTRGQAALGADVHLHLQVQVAVASVLLLLLHLRRQPGFLLLRDRETRLQHDWQQPACPPAGAPEATSGHQAGGTSESCLPQWLNASAGTCCEFGSMRQQKAATCNMSPPSFKRLSATGLICTYCPRRLLTFDRECKHLLSEEDGGRVSKVWWGPGPEKNSTKKKSHCPIPDIRSALWTGSPTQESPGPKANV